MAVKKNRRNFSPQISTNEIGERGERIAVHSVEKLYKTYEKRIFGYFYGLTTDYHRAEELTQETFFQVVRTISFFREDAQVTTWLYQVARNVYNMWKRKQNPGLIPIDEVIVRIPAQREPSEIAEQKEKLALMLRALRQLPENYREVLWLREWQELSYEEIAVVTSHSVSWVKVTLYRARSTYRRIYKEMEE